MDADQTGTPQGGAARVRRHKYFAQQDLGAGAIHLPRACSISLGWSDHRERNPKIRPSAKGRWSYFCLLLPKKIQPGKPCGSMDSGFCATCVFVFLRFFQAISEPPYDILTKPCANRGEKRAVRQHSPLSYFSLMICSYSMAYLFSITILL